MKFLTNRFTMLGSFAILSVTSYQATSYLLFDTLRYGAQEQPLDFASPINARLKFLGVFLGIWLAIVLFGTRMAKSGSNLELRIGIRYSVVMVAILLVAYLVMAIYFLC